MSKGIQYIRAKKSENLFDKSIKVDIKHELSDKIAVEFLSVTSFCTIGYYKWYFLDHFNSVFEFIENTKPVENYVCPDRDKGVDGNVCDSCKEKGFFNINEKQFLS